MRCSSFLHAFVDALILLYRARAALIANPVSFAHLHLAEALGIPLQLSFTMPWSPTAEFSHPLVSVKGAPTETTNYVSFQLSDQLTWTGSVCPVLKLRLLAS